MKFIQYTMLAYAIRKLENKHLNLKYQWLLISNLVTSNCKQYIQYIIWAYMKQRISWFEFTKKPSDISNWIE